MRVLYCVHYKSTKHCNSFACHCSTKELYGTSLFIFHVFCDFNHIWEAERCLVSCNLLLAFLSSCAGAYSSLAITNHSASICVWHLLHSHMWDIDSVELKCMLQGASHLMPCSSKKAKWLPMMVEDMKVICSYLNLDDPCDTAIYTCMVTVFYCIARLGEFTVKTIQDFTPAKHITCCNMTSLHDQNGLPVLQFTLPVTKCEPERGENVQCTPQTGCIMDPEATLRNHLRVNQAPDSMHLFT